MPKVNSRLTRSIDLPNRQAAEDWIDRNQLGRRNLNPDTASLLRGRIYNRTKKAIGRPEINPEKISGIDTAKKMAATYGVTDRTIRNDGQFARAVEDVKKADPTITRGGSTAIAVGEPYLARGRSPALSAPLPPSGFSLPPCAMTQERRLAFYLRCFRAGCCRPSWCLK